MAFLSGVINNAVVRLEGSEKLIGVGTVTLPDIENKTEEISGLGIGNYEEVVQGLYNSLSLTLKFRGMAKNNLTTKGKSINLVIIGAIQGVEEQTHDIAEQKIVITVRGRVKSSKEGELARGGKVEPERVLALTYYKFEIEGEVQHEIDVFNNKAILDGEDVLSAVNAILGN